jgi:RNA polymerase sigma factor (TIGR02999 family)
MSAASSDHITQLLQAWSEGSSEALEQLTPLIYRELHRLAAHYMSRERPGHTLQPTAVVNEAYMRLIDWKNASWQNRAHFFGVSAQLMRRILVDHARSRGYLKRGGGAHAVALDDALLISEEKSAELVALDDALQRLESFDSRKARVVELRFFGGVSVQETAEVLQVSPFTVVRDWNLAKAWLLREIRG